MKKTGIIGGTFNPIHRGHMMIAEAARSAAGLDEVLFIPSGISYMKDPDTVAGGMERLAMVELAIKGIEGFYSSDIEIRRPGNTYTIDTLKELCSNNPYTEYYFIIGADTLFTMETWREPGLIFQRAVIMAAYRKGEPVAAFEAQRDHIMAAYEGARVILMDMEPVDISSTCIREAIAMGRDVSGMLPGGVWDYIREKGLYGYGPRTNSSLVIG